MNSVGTLQATLTSLGNEFKNLENEEEGQFSDCLKVSQLAQFDVTDSFKQVCREYPD